MLRALRETLRQPAVEGTNIFIPLFFFAVTVGAIGGVASKAFGVQDYAGFQMPVAILQGVAGAAGSSGLGMVTDIEKGYFDKLLLTPAPRLSLVLGRLSADGARILVLTGIIIVFGVIAGAGMETGLPGAIMIMIMAGMFGIAYAAIGMAIALKTGSSQAAQAGFLIFFPLLFLSPAFAPKDVFSGWLEFLATINPVTYI
ncbi:MAG TPA: ABC transporter permease, partial [Dehalococcoidia bacterium]